MIGKKFILLLTVFILGISCNNENNNTKIVTTAKTIKKVSENSRNENPNKLSKNEYLKFGAVPFNDTSYLLNISAFEGSYSINGKAKEITFVAMFYTNKGLIKTINGLSRLKHDKSLMEIGNAKFRFYVIDKSIARIKTNINTGFEFLYRIKTQGGEYNSPSAHFTNEEFDISQIRSYGAFKEKHYENDILPVAYIVGYPQNCKKCGYSSFSDENSLKEMINTLKTKKEDFRLIVLGLKIKK